MHKILVVDDSETVRNLLEDLLTSLNYQPILAQNGVEAYELAKEVQNISLVLCDINMPELDGMSFCELLYKESLLKDVPKFILTTESSIEMKMRGKACGVTAWVTKPILPEKLSKAISVILLGSK